MPNLLVLRRRARVIARRRIGARRKRFAMRGKMANKPLVKLIRAVMKREEETKYVANSYDSTLAPLANTWNSAGTLAAATAWYPAIPKLNQGTGDYQRVGSKIQPVSCTVSMKVGFNPKTLAPILYMVSFIMEPARLLGPGWRLCRLATSRFSMAEMESTTLLMETGSA